MRFASITHSIRGLRWGQRRGRSRAVQLARGSDSRSRSRDVAHVPFHEAMARLAELGLLAAKLPVDSGSAILIDEQLEPSTHRRARRRHVTRSGSSRVQPSTRHDETIADTDRVTVFTPAGVRLRMAHEDSNGPLIPTRSDWVEKCGIFMSHLLEYASP